MDRPELIAVGDVMLDVAVEGAGHLASVRVRPGGSSANVAVWAAEAGARATVVGRVGDDPPGRMLRAALEERGVTALLAVDGERPTGSVVSAPGGLAVDRGATAALAPGDLPEVLRAGAVLVSGYALFQPGSAAAARAALARADAEWVAVDAGSTRAAAADTDAMEGANALLTDAEAARALTGLGVADAAAVLGQSFQLACVTQGAAGASASLDGDVATVPAPRVQAVDVVGAGDAFAAGLLIALLRSEPLSAALEAGCLLGTRAAASDGRWPT